MAAYENIQLNSQYENVTLDSVPKYENIILPCQDPDSRPKPPAKPPREKLTHLYNEAAKRINVPLLEDYMRNAKDKGYFEMEFKEIPKSMAFPCEVALANKSLNRYRNILPYDKNRVVLETIQDQPGSDYYNASFIKSYSEENAYIASSGPVLNTLNNFWRMVWETECDIIIMLTNTVELGNVKCVQYWPEKKEEKSVCGKIKITKSQEIIKGDYVERNLTVMCGSKQRTIKHFQYTEWPDHGVPMNVSALLRMRKYIKKHKRRGHPVTVHCSAGVGRTGTFLALDYLLDQADKELVVNVYDCVLQLRQQRAEAVQTLVQYEFVYQACLDALVVGSTTYGVLEFSQILSDLKKGPHGARPIETHYRMLDMVCTGSKKDERAELTSEDKAKNRRTCQPPSSQKRVRLMTPVEGSSDYINAVFVDGYKKKNAFIATQAPLANTVVDLWRTVWDYNCSTIVMLCHFSKLKADELYFPTEKLVCHTAPFQVDHVTSDDVKIGHVITRTFTVSLRGHKRKIRHLSSMLDLETIEVNQKFKILTQIYEMLSAPSRDKKSLETPVLIHCVDGISTTGLVCCLFPAFDQITSDNEVDVFQHIRQARTSRPQFIVSEKQYESLLDLTSLYINKKRSEQKGVYCAVELSDDGLSFG